jgi:hypothetical protein
MLRFMRTVVGSSYRLPKPIFAEFVGVGSVPDDDTISDIQPQAMRRFLGHAGLETSAGFTYRGRGGRDADFGSDRGGNHSSDHDDDSGQSRFLRRQGRRRLLRKMRMWEG